MTESDLKYAYELGNAWWWDCPDPATDGPQDCPPFKKGSQLWRAYKDGWEDAKLEASGGQTDMRMNIDEL